MILRRWKRAKAASCILSYVKKKKKNKINFYVPKRKIGRGCVISEVSHPHPQYMNSKNSWTFDKFFWWITIYRYLLINILDKNYWKNISLRIIVLVQTNKYASISLARCLWTESILMDEKDFKWIALFLSAKKQSLTYV